jgi:hypothetical protein
MPAYRRLKTDWFGLNRAKAPDHIGAVPSNPICAIARKNTVPVRLDQCVDSVRSRNNPDAQLAPSLQNTVILSWWSRILLEIVRIKSTFNAKTNKNLEGAGRALATGDGA